LLGVGALANPKFQHPFASPLESVQSPKNMRLAAVAELIVFAEELPAITCKCLRQASDLLIFRKGVAAKTL
jgi:hypothetical protein